MKLFSYLKNNVTDTTPLVPEIEDGFASVTNDFEYSQEETTQIYNKHFSDVFYYLTEAISASFKPHSTILYLKKDRFFKLEQTVTQNPNIIAQNLSPNHGVISGVIKNQQSLYLSHVRGQLQLNYYTDNTDIQSVILAPIIANATVVGLIIVDFNNIIKDSQRVQDIRDTLELNAKVMGRLITESSHVDTSSRLKDEFETFFEMSRELNECKELNQIFDVFFTHTKKIAHYHDALIILNDDDQNRIISSTNQVQQFFKNTTFELRPSEDLLSWVIQNGVSLCYNDFDINKHHISLAKKNATIFKRTRSILITPLSVGQHAIGCVVFLKYYHHPYTTDAKRVLEVITNEAALRLHNARMYMHMRSLATQDSLTGLANHRQFQEKIEQSLERVKRYPEPLSLILLDIDHFKSINDTHGHPVGDEVLVEIGNILRELTRNVDIPSRVGGEEFAIILIATPIQGAINLAERIRQRLHRSPIATKIGKLPIRMSMGIATCPEDSYTSQGLIEKADQSLYTAKNNGRDRIVCYANLGKDSLKKQSVQ